MEKLKFYNMKLKKSFESEDWEVRTRGERNFAVHTTQDGTECWRILGKDFGMSKE